MKIEIYKVLQMIFEGVGKDIPLESLITLITDKTEYESSTIKVAFGLVYDKILTSNMKNKKKNKSKNFRILTEDEIEEIGVENYNYLMKLENVGILNSLDINTIIEHISIFPNVNISREDINLLILLSLVDFEDDILPGNRMLLFASDTIN